MIVEAIILSITATAYASIWLKNQREKREDNNKWLKTNLDEPDTNETIPAPIAKGKVRRFVSLKDMPCPFCGKVRVYLGTTPCWDGPQAPKAHNPIVHKDCNEQTPHLHMTCSVCDSNWLMAPKDC